MGRTTRHFNNALWEKGDAPKKLRAVLKEKTEKYETWTSFSKPSVAWMIAENFNMDSKPSIIYPASWEDHNARWAINQKQDLDSVIALHNSSLHIVDKDTEAANINIVLNTFDWVFDVNNPDFEKKATWNNSPDQNIWTSSSQSGIVFPAAFPDAGYSYGKWWMELNRSLRWQALKDIPISFDASINPTYFLIPKYYNWTNTSKRKVFINNWSTPIVPTVNEQGEEGFILSFSTINGFVNGNNVIRYEFENSDWLLTWINKSFILSNVYDVVAPTIVTINNVK